MADEFNDKFKELRDEVMPEVKFLKEKFLEHNKDIARNRRVTTKASTEFSKLKEELGEVLNYFDSRIRFLEVSNKVLFACVVAEALYILSRL